MSASGFDLELAEIASLEEVVDRDALTDLCRSTFALFGISVRVISRAGTLLADVHEQQSICRYVNSFGRGSIACAEVVGAVKRTISDEETLLHPCFTGALYRIVPIGYQGRPVGQFVLGPYLPAERTRVPRSLLRIDSGISAEQSQTALAELPRVREETARRIADHLQGVVELLLFSRHRALLTSQMHIASVRESYRQLAEQKAKLEKTFEELKELDRLKSNFLATVSHELRTPLTSILGYSEMLDIGIGGTLSDEQREFVQTIQSKGEHLLALITNLLDAGKLEQANVRLALEEVRAEVVVKDVETTVGPKASKKNVRVVSEIGENLPVVEADPMRLRQVLINLADNAVKFSKDGGTVRLGAFRATMPEPAGDVFGAALMGAAPAALMFTIEDDGIGMPPDSLEKIFDAFFQVDSSSTREHEGAGLGLSIVKKLVDAHRGHIEVVSAPEQGTTFRVYFPEPDDPL